MTSIPGASLARATSSSGSGHAAQAVVGQADDPVHLLDVPEAVDHPAGGLDGVLEDERFGEGRRLVRPPADQAEDPDPQAVFDEDGVGLHEALGEPFGQGVVPGIARAEAEVRQDECRQAVRGPRRGEHLRHARGLQVELVVAEGGGVAPHRLEQPELRRRLPADRVEEGPHEKVASVENEHGVRARGLLPRDRRGEARPAADGAVGARPVRPVVDLRGESQEVRVKVVRMHDPYGLLPRVQRRGAPQDQHGDHTEDARHRFLHRILLAGREPRGRCRAVAAFTGCGCLISILSAPGGQARTAPAGRPGSGSGPVAPSSPVTGCRPVSGPHSGGQTPDRLIRWATDCGGGKIMKNEYERFIVRKPTLVSELPDHDSARPSTPC